MEQVKKIKNDKIFGQHPSTLITAFAAIVCIVADIMVKPHASAFLWQAVGIAIIAAGNIAWARFGYMIIYVLAFALGGFVIMQSF